LEKYNQQKVSVEKSGKYKHAQRYLNHRQNDESIFLK